MARSSARSRGLQAGEVREGGEVPLAATVNGAGRKKGETWQGTSGVFAYTKETKDDDEDIRPHPAALGQRSWGDGSGVRHDGGADCGGDCDNRRDAGHPSEYGIHDRLECPLTNAPPTRCWWGRTRVHGGQAPGTHARAPNRLTTKETSDDDEDVRPHSAALGQRSCGNGGGGWHDGGADCGGDCDDRRD